MTSWRDKKVWTLPGVADALSRRLFGDRISRGTHLLDRRHFQSVVIGKRQFPGQRQRAARAGLKHGFATVLAAEVREGDAPAAVVEQRTSRHGGRRGTRAECALNFRDEAVVDIIADSVSQACINPDVSGTSASTGLPGYLVHVRIPSLLVARLCPRRERIPEAGMRWVEV